MTRDGPSTSATLLEQVRNWKNDPAWRTFYDRYSVLVEKWCRLRGLCEDDVQEVTQVVFFRLAEKLHGFHYDRSAGSFRGWLKTVTWHETVRFFEQQQRLARVGGRATGNPEVAEQLQQACDSAIPADEEAVMREAEEDEKKLFAAAQAAVIRRVGAETWKAFVEHVLQDRKAAEVAAELGLTITAVHKTKRRIMQMLREEIAGSPSRVPE